MEYTFLVIGFHFHVASSVVIFVLLKYILIYCIIFNYLCIIIIFFFFKNVLLKYRLWVHHI